MSAFYHIGINTGSLVDFVEDKSMSELCADDDRNLKENFDEISEEWAEMGYGWCSPTSFENRNEDLLYDVDDCDDFFETTCDGELMIKSNHPNIANIINEFKNLSDRKYYNDNKEEIGEKDFHKLIKTQDSFILTLCELDFN
tara:strand:- start:30 stop:455 length:426 start_codon:yes stop_codon:yes gene_type:complete